VPGVAQQLPTIHIKGGKAEVENYSEPQEIIITKDEDYKIALLIDLETDKETLLDKTIDENTILLILTKDELIGFEPDGGVSELPLSTFEKDITLSKDNIGEWIDSSVSFAAYIGIPFFVLFLFIFRISLALLMALLADATKPNTITLSFTNAMSLGIVAMTPSIMISTAVQYFGVHIPFSLALYATISILYLRFALKAVEELAPTPTEAVITNVNNE